MVLGWVINGGEVGVKGIKRRGLGKGLGYWGALRAGWEFLGTPPRELEEVWITNCIAQTDFAQEPVFMNCEDPAVSLLSNARE